MDVAVCTYNGASYLAEQLESIESQSRPVDGLVVRDDVSSDSTLEVVEEFARRTKLDCKIINASANTGSTKNFEACIQECQGEIVFLADQDDRWHPEKVSRLLPAFDDPDVGLVFSDANMIDADGNPLGYTLWQAIRFGPHEQSQMRSSGAFDLLLRRYVTTGATIAFRRKLIADTFPFASSLIHDAWITLVLSAISKIEFVDAPLIDYRQHEKQQIGEAKRGLLGQYRRAKQLGDRYFDDQHHAFIQLREHLLTLRDRWVHPDIGTLLDQKIAHVDRRVRMRNRNRVLRLPAVAYESVLGTYSKFGYGWKSAAQDLFL